MFERLPYVTGPVYTATFSVLPAQMDSPEARAMLTAIGLQESRFRHRRQIGGPARGFWQFETAGIAGVLEHPATKLHVSQVLRVIGYSANVSVCHEAVEHNDILACAFARLLLWSHSAPLPRRGEHAKAWDYYLSLWRPGKPHRNTWDELYDEAWS